MAIAYATHTGLPIVRLQLGESLSVVAKSAPQLFDLDRLLDDQVTVINKPVEFEYTNSRYGFLTPPASFVSLKSFMGYVYSARVSPQLDYLDRAGALNLIQDLAQMLGSRGWKSVTEEWRESLFELTGLPESHPQSSSGTLRIGRWRGEDADEAEIELDHVHKAGRLTRMLGRNAGLYLVSLLLTNEQHEVRLHRDLKEERLSHGADAHKIRQIEI